MSLFNAARILLLLFIYDMAFIFISILFENDLEVCVSHAILTTLVVLGILIFIRAVEKVFIVKVESYIAEVNIQKNIREEYQRARKQTIRNDLLNNAVCPNKRRASFDQEVTSQLPSDFRFIQFTYNKKTR